MWAHTNEETDYLSSPAETQSRLADFRHTSRIGFGWLKLPRWVRAWRQRETLRAELRQLSPRTLADLGISRADFPAIVADTFDRNGQDPGT
jgi:uncharacterized protein YjiS (DUF1127 family)